jgi:hypothetical protein
MSEIEIQLGKVILKGSVKEQLYCLDASFFRLRNIFSSGSIISLSTWLHSSEVGYVSKPSLKDEVAPMAYCSNLGDDHKYSGC